MRYILIVLWLLLGLAYYLLSNFCEKDDLISSSINQENISTPIIPKETPCPIINAFAFERGSANLIQTGKWNAFRDSLLVLLTNDKKIQIVGLEFEGESVAQDLGMQRANALSKAMGLPEEKLQVYASKISKPTYKIDCQIPGARIKLVTVTEKIKEIQDRTLIYFPYNSTNKLNDKEVETYLDAVAKKVINSNERIRLTGHTDDKGEPEYNLSLGQSRAEVIRNYLLSRNVPLDNILVFSEGEINPIADNNTEQGRAQNRRTELEIIK